MNSDYDITLHNDETSSPAMARERFLDSLGLGENKDCELEATDSVVVDEGVVLSSQPDDLELPAAESDSSAQRAGSYSLGSSSERTRTVSISISPKDRIPAATAEVETEEFNSDKTTKFNESLALECPECHGELVLQRRHLGIEGLCVWCHTPIIAAESARDSIVRVFPVLGRVTKRYAAAVAQTAAPAVVEEVKKETVAEVEIPAPALEQKEEISPFNLDALYATSSFREDTAEPTAPSAGFGETMAGGAVTGSPDAEAPVTGFGAFLQSGAPKGPAPSPIADSWSTPAAPAPQETAEFSAAPLWGPPPKPASDAMALPALAPTAADEEANASLPTDFASGFGAPAPAPAPAPEPIPTATSPAAPDATGGDFAAAPRGTAFEEPVTAIVTEESVPVIETPAPKNDFASAFPTGGFGSPASPSDLGGFTVPGQANTTFAAAPLTSDFAAGFQASGFDAPAPAPMFEAAPETPTTPEAPVDDFAAAFASAGFGVSSPEQASASAAPTPGSFSSFMDPSPAGPAAEPLFEALETPEFTFQNSPASKSLFEGPASDERRSFAMPGNGFSTGSSSENEEQPTLFQDIHVPAAEAPASGWGISEPIGFSSPDAAPVALSSGPTFVPGAGLSTGSSFENAPFPAPASNPSSPAPEAPVSLFSEAAPAIASPPTPPLLQPQEPTFSSINNPIEAAAPNVVSAPLGSKPKPKVRKGFIVLMVVIVGFAAGAALASFVLPIDEYVQAARSLMDQKFSPGPAIQQFPETQVTFGEEAEPTISVPEP